MKGQIDPLPVGTDLEQNDWLRVKISKPGELLPGMEMSICLYLQPEWHHFRHHRFEMEIKRKVYSRDIHFLLAVFLFLLSPIRWIAGEYILNLVNNDKYVTYLDLTWGKPVRKPLVYLMKQENTNFIRSCCFPIDNCSGSCLRSDNDLINE